MAMMSQKGAYNEANTQYNDSLIGFLEKAYRAACSLTFSIWSQMMKTLGNISPGTVSSALFHCDMSQRHVIPIGLLTRIPLG